MNYGNIPPDILNIPVCTIEEEIVPLSKFISNYVDNDVIKADYKIITHIDESKSIISLSIQTENDFYVMYNLAEGAYLRRL